ncbi:MAG: ABC transporter permease subunit [Kiritimatiellia bacterium]
MNESFYRKVRRADTAAKWAIMSIGIGIIGLVITILVVIASVSAPLFKPAAAKPAAGGRLQTPPGALAAGMDEYLQNVYVIDRRAGIHFAAAAAATNAAGRTESLQRPAALLSVDPTGPHQFTFLYEDGVARAVQLNFPTRFDAATKSPVVVPEVLTLAELPAVTNAVPGRSMIVKSGDGFLRLDLIRGRDLGIRFRAEKKNLLGKVKITESALVLANVASSTVLSWAYSPEFQDLYLGTETGELLRLDLRDPAAPDLAERVQASPDGSSLTALGLAFGQVSIVVGDAAGRVATYSRVRRDGPASPPRLFRIHELGRHADAVRLILPSGRDKTVYSLARDGSLQANHLTSGRNLLSLPPRAGVETFGVSRRGERVLLVDDRGGADLWEVNAPHPEVSVRVLFGKTWYESYDKPAHVWQSTSGNDDFEPKLSLVPLVLGSLKGALYAMLFAIPVAVLAALYTNQFMSPGMRQSVKPAVEIMAAMPSVVIGFLAGLWLAPLLENKLPGVFLAPVFLPLTIWAYVVLKRALGRHPSVRWMDRGMEWLGVIPAVLLGGWLSLRLGEWIQDAFMGGDFRQWWFSQTGAKVDQRNCVVVAFALGFAVIPLIFTLSEDALNAVPRNLTAASLALGASRWQTAWQVIIPSASPGIFAAIMIGLGRAVGETMILLMCTGNTAITSWSVFNGMRTLAANIAVEIPEAPTGGTHYRILFLSAVVLFGLTFLVNTAAEMIRIRLRKKYGNY